MIVHKSYPRPKKNGTDLTKSVQEVLAYPHNQTSKPIPLEYSMGVAHSLLVELKSASFLVQDLTRTQI